MHAVVARMGVIIASWLSVLMGHSSAVELQMRRKGGLAGMAASPICLTCSSGGYSSIYRPLMSFTRNQAKYSHFFLNLESRMGSHTKEQGILGFHNLPQRVLATRRLSDWAHWTGGSIPAARTGLENCFVCKSLFI